MSLGLNIKYLQKLMNVFKNRRTSTQTRSTGVYSVEQKFYTSVQAFDCSTELMENSVVTSQRRLYATLAMLNTWIDMKFCQLVQHLSKSININF